MLGFWFAYFKVGIGYYGILDASIWWNALSMTILWLVIVLAFCASSGTIVSKKIQIQDAYRLWMVSIEAMIAVTSFAIVHIIMKYSDKYFVLEHQNEAMTPAETTALFLVIYLVILLLAGLLYVGGRFAQTRKSSTERKSIKKLGQG